MRIVFLGTSDYGEPALRAMARECFEVAAVVTQPDTKCGRGLHAAPCAIKQAALGLGLKVVQPENINRGDAVSLLKELKPDLLVIIAYGQILSAEVLAIPSIMAVNVHGSLLPALRGPAPVNWALINGETATGNTLFKLVRKMDAGPVILQREQEILAEDDALTLEKRLARSAAELLLDGLKLICSGKYELEEQDEAKATYCRKLKKEDALIDWTAAAESVRDRIRGLAGWPGSLTFYKQSMLKIFAPASAVAWPGEEAAGTVAAVGKDGITVRCGKGALVIREIQPAGKRRMSVVQFIAGHRVKVGERFCLQ